MKKKTISILVTIALVGFLGLYLYQNKEVFGEIERIEAIQIVPIVILILTNLYINGLLLKTLTLPFRINLKEHYLLSITSSFLNMITPFRGGAGFRAAYMKKKYKLNYTHFLSSLSGNYIVVFLTNSLLALIISIYYFLTTQYINIPIIVFFSLMLLLTTTLIILPINIKPTNFITFYLNKLLTGWNIIKQSHQTIIKIIILVIINIAFTTMINILLFRAISFEINYLQALYFSTLGILTTFISITPGALGITEGSYIVISIIIGVPPEISLISALLLRVILTITLLTIGPISNIILIKKLTLTKSHTSANTQ